MKEREYVVATLQGDLEIVGKWVELTVSCRRDTGVA